MNVIYIHVIYILELLKEFITFFCRYSIKLQKLKVRVIFGHIVYVSVVGNCSLCQFVVCPLDSPVINTSLNIWDEHVLYIPEVLKEIANFSSRYPIKLLKSKVSGDFWTYSVILRMWTMTTVSLWVPLLVTVGKILKWHNSKWNLFSMTVRVY